ncbi:MAG: intradiol ring-cleavage dioxygenase [Gammaproteobacteria bacterium]|nr:intradiol ring-cleavage dioxygenase [Gammaproteobacteria bacterium]
MERRGFIRSALTAGLVASPLGAALGAARTLPKTPSDYEGPYYPVGPRHQTNDLVIGTPRQAIFNFAGRVVSVNGEPRAAVLVDIWHTDPLGRYRHPRDSAPGERWEDFLYYGEAVTDTDGQFHFRTYLPGAYGRRPAHIHYKVWQDKRELLTSQVYFSQTGGTRGASQNASKADLQTIQLDSVDDAINGFIRVVL